MSFFRTDARESNPFGCTSSFTPYVPPEQIDDGLIQPDIVKQKTKKKNEIQYLPGEKLLIKIGKQRKAKKLKHDDTVDIERVTQSLSRVLNVL
jgi:hypothetical protein